MDGCRRIEAGERERRRSTYLDQFINGADFERESLILVTISLNNDLFTPILLCIGSIDKESISISISICICIYICILLSSTTYGEFVILDDVFIALVEYPNHIVNKRMNCIPCCLISKNKTETEGEGEGEGEG